MATHHIQQGGGFVQEHLVHWQVSLGKGAFWTLHLDTLVVSIIIGIAFLGLFRWIAVKAISDRPPGKMQNLLEILVTFIQNCIKESYHGEGNLLGSMALVILVWVFLLSFMDLLPVDLVPRFVSLFGIHYFRAVPTDDPNLTFAMSLSVFVLIIYYNFSSKGPIGLGKEILCSPFGPWLFPLNIFFRLLEEFVKPLSLSLRLFGNIFAGELIFVLIALLPWEVQWVPGIAWSLFHILVILIQSYIFMILTIVYLSMANRLHE